MHATRSLFVLLFVACASSQLAAGQGNSVESFMEKMTSGMDGLNTRMQGISDMLRGHMSQGMDDLTSRLKDMSGRMSNNMDFDMDGFTSRIKDAGESMMNSMNDRMTQGSEFFSGQLIPHFQGLSEDMKSLFPAMSL